MSVYMNIDWVRSRTILTNWPNNKAITITITILLAICITNDYWTYHSAISSWRMELSTWNLKKSSNYINILNYSKVIILSGGYSNIS